MADPSNYTPGFSFSGYQAENPADPLPGQNVDNELAAIAVAIAQLVAAVKDIRRSDGALKTGVVTIDSLAEETVEQFAGSSAYQIAVDNGFSGTEEEWLASLHGDDGAAATIAVGSVSTLAAGVSATVVNAGTSAAAIFNFGIPRGATGLSGPGTGDMLRSTYDPTLKTADAFSMDQMVEGATTKILTAAERTKLSGIATGATANSSDATLKARANHTGTQAISTVTSLQTTLDGKQPLAAVLTATTASFTTTLKTKLDGIATAATANDTDANLKREAIIVAVGDESTALTTGTAKVTFRMPYAFTLVGLPVASLTTAQASGSIFTVDINENGTTILSTKLTIDNTEETSATALTPAVVSDTSIASGAEITIDIDQVGNGSATGLKVALIGYRT